MKKEILLIASIILLLQAVTAVTVGAAECIFDITNSTGSVIGSANLTDVCSRLDAINSSLAAFNSNLNSNYTLLVQHNNKIDSIINNMTSVNFTNVTLGNTTYYLVNLNASYYDTIAAIKSNITSLNASVASAFTYYNSLNQYTQTLNAIVNEIKANYSSKTNLEATNTLLTDLTNAYNKHVTNITMHPVLNNSSNSTNYILYAVVIIIIAIIIMLVWFKWK